MEKIRAIKVELFVPEELATGEQIGGRALVFAKYACHIDEAGVDSVTEIQGGAIVTISETDFAFTRRTGKSRRTE